MSFYRTMLAALAAVVIASPVFADDNNATNQPSDDTKAVQLSDNSQTNASDQQSTTESKLNLNKATAKDLAKLKGLNASKAKSIVAYRKKHGDFKSLDDLMKVKGLKKMKSDQVKEIEDQLTLE